MSVELTEVRKRAETGSLVATTRGIPAPHQAPNKWLSARVLVPYLDPRTACQEGEKGTATSGPAKSLLIF